jgi:hypothetical protein
VILVLCASMFSVLICLINHQYILASDSGVMCLHVHISHLLDQYILASDSSVMCLHVHIPHLLDTI